MKGEISDQAVIKATGRSKNDWYAVIEKAAQEKKTHKQVAEFLRTEHGLSPWWSQEITVLFEKASGARVTGQTKDTGFQVGVNKTFPLSLKKLWDLVFMENRLGLFKEDEKSIHGGLEGINNDGTKYKLTTYKPYSHVRMQWQLPEWEQYSILQIRVTAKNNNKTVLTIHQEKLKNKQVREQMKLFWKKELETKI